jgi:hypothetical protein
MMLPMTRAKGNDFPVRMPGPWRNATITVNVPAWKERVTPLQISVPVAAEQLMAEKADAANSTRSTR